MNHSLIKIKYKKIAIYAVAFLFYFFNSFLYADEEVQVPTQLSEPVNVNKNPLINANYDSETFELAYKTFLYSGNVKDAFALSLGATKKMPKSLVWRERLIQTAIWTNNIDVALEQLTYLIESEHQAKFLTQAIKMASDLSRYDSLIPLLEYQYKLHPDDTNIIAALGIAYDQSGQPERALTFLRQNNAKHANKQYLQIIANIYRELGDDRNASKTLTEIEEQYGATVNNALMLAEIDYKHAKLKEALQQLMALPTSNHVNNPDFWKTEAELSWIVGKEAISRRDYMKLYNLNQISEEGLERLLLLQPKSAARQTLSIAIKAWQQYHNIAVFLQATNLAIGLRDWNTLTALYHMPLSASLRVTLADYPDYWNARILILQHSGKAFLIVPFLLQAVLDYPGNSHLKLMYLNAMENQLSLFVPHSQPDYLMSALAVWQTNASKNDDWADVYVRAFMLFDQPKKALSVYDAEKSTQTHHTAWYNSYSQLLETLNYNKSAYEVRLASWQKIQKNLRLHDKEDYDFWGAYNELAAYFSPAATTYFLSSYLATANPSSSAADSLMAWALAHNSYELAAYLAAYYYSEGIPAWAALKLAIMQNDQVKMHKMLATMPYALPRKDRVEAANRVDEIALAQTLAYEGMKNSRESERYQIMVDAFLQTANTAVIETEYEQFGSMQGPRTNINAKLYLTNFISIKPYTVIWDPKTNNVGNLASHSYFDKRVGVVLRRKTSRSDLSLDFYDRDLLYNYYAAEICGEYGVTSQLTLTGRLGYNQRSTLNAFMLLVGTQDRYQGIVNYGLSVRDKAVVSLEYDTYHLQDRTLLGNGTVITGEYDHKFWLEYPDFTLQITGSINRFNPYNSLIQGPVLKIFPSSVAPTAQNLLTRNFWQTGINFVFGDSLREEYTHAWRPYSNIGGLYASTSGYGTSVDVGIAGSLVGRDKLSFYYSRSSSNQGRSQINFLIGAHYQLYI